MAGNDYHAKPALVAEANMRSNDPVWSHDALTENSPVPVNSDRSDFGMPVPRTDCETSPAGPPKVLFLIPSLRGGGAERVFVTLMRHLDAARIDATLAVVDGSDAVYRHDLPRGLEVVDLRSSRVRYALPGIIRLIWTRRPDVVVSTLGHMNLALASMRPFLPGSTRLIGREASIVRERLSGRPDRAFWNWLYRRAYRRLDHVISQSRYMRGELIEAYGLYPERVTVINNPVDFEAIAALAGHPAGEHAGMEFPWRDKVNIVAAGRLVPAKGFDLLLEALALCGDDRLHVTILGQGPQSRYLQDLATELRIANSVTFAGFQANPYAWFVRADLFVLCSRLEPFPNVVLEALACGTPVIATPAPGGIGEILDPIRHCRIADDMSAGALADALRHWLDGSRERVPAGSVQDYAAERITRHYENLILKLINP